MNVLLILVIFASANASPPPPGSDPIPDPNCARGVSTDESLPSTPGSTCCAASCGACGGSSCGHESGGALLCCEGSIKTENRSCSQVGSPCMMPPAPPPLTKCGDYPAPLSATMPNVLMIGDSISMSVPYTPGGYGAPARAMLLNQSISPWHSGGFEKGGQASNTVKGVLCTDPHTDGNWLNFTGTYDVIHFNFGLHDLVDAAPSGEGTEHVNLTQYGKNLVTIYNRLAARAKKVIWVATTPCPNVTTSMGRSDAKVRAYNARALEVLQPLAAKSGAALLIDDLHAAVDGYCGVNYKTCVLQRPKNVHFEPIGCTFLAKHVVSSIVGALFT